MTFSYVEKNIVITEALKAQVEKKLGKLKRIVPEDSGVRVTLSETRHNVTIEVSVNMRKRLLRAETTSANVASALDSIVDMLDKQIKKYKGRLRDKRFKAAPEELATLEDGDEGVSESESEIVIRRSKKFAFKPMDPQEAALSMDLLGHSFYVFRNSKTDEVNVLYRRKNDEYGLIEPE